jgi:hypothetical protein
MLWRYPASDRSFYVLLRRSETGQHGDVVRDYAERGDYILFQIDSFQTRTSSML